MTSTPSPILQVNGLSKSFSGAKALDNVHFDLQKGEVHAIMGENGAGKSTFMKILMGLLAPDAGELVFEGQTLKNNNVHQMLKKGIAMIHQEILAVPELTVAQNIFLGRETTKWLPNWLNNKAIDQQAETILAEMGLDINPKTKMKHLGVAQMQMVEIAKAISTNAKVIIMDEPTSAISDKEVAVLFKIIKDLTAKGVAIVYISHKMDEIYQIADRITVLRDGQYIATKNTADLAPKDLIANMVGREITALYPESIAASGAVLLSVKALTKKGKFSDINFEVKAGEVLGMAGLMGAGRTEIARAIYGLDPCDSGEIWVNNQKIAVKSPQDAIKNGIGYVSEDRKGWGFVPQMSVQHNISLTYLPHFAKNHWIQNRLEVDAAKKTVEDLKIKTAGIDQKVTHLSGGNQQKVVIGRVLLAQPHILILDEPTRGVDVGAKFEIYKLINQLKVNGTAIILISSELPEILGMSDRILVLSKGKQTALFSRQEATQEKIMRHAVH